MEILNYFSFILRNKRGAPLFNQDLSPGLIFNTELNEMSCLMLNALLIGTDRLIDCKQNKIYTLNSREKVVFSGYCFLFTVFLPEGANLPLRDSVYLCIKPTPCKWLLTQTIVDVFE